MDFILRRKKFGYICKNKGTFLVNYVPNADRRGCYQQSTDDRRLFIDRSERIPLQSVPND